MYMSGPLQTWLFGVLHDRIATRFWQTFILERDLPNVLGYAWPLALIAIGGALMSRLWWAAIAAAFTFLSAPLIFSSLYQQDYYVCANGLFAVVATAIGIGALFAEHRALLASVLLAAIATGQVAYYRAAPFFVFSNMDTRNDAYQIALAAKQATPSDGVLVVTGMDWSSEVPFYAERRAVDIPPGIPFTIMDAFLANPSMLTGPYPLAGLVSCPNPAIDYSRIRSRVEILKGRMKLIRTIGSCELYLPKS
jgi:hypothetical protein